MNLALQSDRYPDNSTLTSSELAQACCVLAREHEEKGNYEAAAEALQQWWQMGGEPQLTGLDLGAAAEVYLRAGTLCGWIGSSEQIANAQKMAQGLLHRSIALFAQLDQTVRAAEGQIELACCYWREGSLDLARTTLHAALEVLPEAETDLRIIALVRSAIIKWASANFDEARRILMEAAPLAKLSVNHSVKGRFHQQYASTLKNLGLAQGRTDYIDQAINEYEAARHYFGLINHTRYCAVIENNLGFLMLEVGNFDDAHKHLICARQLSTSIPDSVLTAQFDDTRTRVFLAEKRYVDAEKLIREVIKTLEQGGQQALLAQSLITRGVVLAQLKRYDDACLTFEHARDLAEECREYETAGRAVLTLIEELFDYLDDDDRQKHASRADRLLATSKHAPTLERLQKCQERIRRAHEALERARAVHEEELRRAAFYDQLTGLPNRALLVDHLQQAIARSRRDRDHLFAVLFIDLDRIKLVNDRLGHSAGNELLVQVASRLNECIRQLDTVARIGGDEFAILLDRISDSTEAIMVTERIQQALSSHFDLDGHEVYITASIGIAMSATGCESPDQILRNADTAMYRAKKGGTGCWELFDQAMHAQAMERLMLESDLRRAVERKEFHLHYQPLVDIAAGRLAGFEALLRWQHVERGFVSPAEFIPLAEETGLIIPLGQWVLAESCRQMREWQQATPVNRELTLSVNMSARQLVQRDLVEQVKQTLQETGFDPYSLKLEITESVVMENTEVAVKRLEQLRELGVQLSMDDFGTGYSSLSCLHSFPVTTLKIDRSFVNRLGEAEGSYATVRTIIMLAQSLRMNVVAEGVETEEQLGHLAALGCEYAQGYLLSRPLTVEAAAELIRNDRQWMINCAFANDPKLAQRVSH